MERLVLSWVGRPFAFELMPGLNRLGRNPTNDFRVADASISSFHCEVTLDPDGTVRIQDLASTNGTFIDGVQVTEGTLSPGQSLRLGNVELQLERGHIAEPVLEPVAAGASSTWGEPEKASLMSKLTRTLKITFSR